MATAISNRPVPVSVEYSAFGKRIAKHFEDASDAKAFYASKFKAGAQPVVKGEHASVTNGAAVETEPKSVEKPSKEPKAKAKPVKHAKKAPKQAEEPARDNLGCRVGSMSSQINEHISTKPKSIEKLIEQTGLASARVRAHIKFLVAKKLIVENKDGVRRAGKN